MRFSIQNSTIEKVKVIGGKDIKITSIGIIFAELTPEQVNQLKNQGATLTPIGSVKAVVMSPIISPPIIAAIPTYSPEELIWAAKLEDVRALTDPPLLGNGVNIAVIGTGIRETHDRIQGRVVFRKNYSSDPLLSDGLNHDTGTCDIIVTMVPLCNILNMKVLDSKGEGTEESVVLAIDDCISMQDTNPAIAPTVINLSLGAPDDNNVNNILRVACRAAIAKGIFIFASAGNDGPSPYSITIPAVEKYVFACGAAKYLPNESSFIVSNFSSRGPTLGGLIKPDVVLFGEDIQVASSSSDSATIAKSGTSFAAPFGSAIAAIYLEGALRQAMWKQVYLGVPMGAIYYVPPDRMIDEYLPLICLKPKGISMNKDYDYGNGLPYGPSALKLFAAAPVATDISTVLASISPIFSIAILAMLMGSMVKPEKGG